MAVFLRADPKTSYQILLNDTQIGSWNGADLKKGISLPLNKIND